MDLRAQEMEVNLVSWREGLWNHPDIKRAPRPLINHYVDCKEIKPVNPKGNQPWIFIGRSDSEAEAPTLWPPDLKSWLTGKDPDAGSNLKKAVRMWRLEGIIIPMDMNLNKLQETEEDRGAWCAVAVGLQRVRHNLATEQPVMTRGKSCHIFVRWPPFPF